MKMRILANGKLTLEDVKGNEIKFRHFSGEKDKYHSPGQRDFNIAVPDDIGEELIVNGWRVKAGKEKVNDDGEIIKYSAMIKVKVNFDSRRPPRITRYTSNGHVEIDEDIVKDLDVDEIESAAFVLTPYINRSSADSDGKATAYLEVMRYKIEDDPFAGLYEDEV